MYFIELFFHTVCQQKSEIFVSFHPSGSLTFWNSRMSDLEKSIYLTLYLMLIIEGGCLTNLKLACFLWVIFKACIVRKKLILRSSNQKGICYVHCTYMMYCKYKILEHSLHKRWRKYFRDKNKITHIFLQYVTRIKEDIIEQKKYASTKLKAENLESVNQIITVLMSSRHHV